MPQVAIRKRTNIRHLPDAPGAHSTYAGSAATVLILAVGSASSIAQERSIGMASEEHKAIVRRWFEETDKGNLDIIDELCASDYIDHAPPLPGMPAGSAGVREANRQLRAAFPDTIHIIEDQVAEGDKVVTRLRGRGTFANEILGIPPNGKVVEITGIAIHRLKEGMLVEHWANADLLSFMQQLGAIPTAGRVDP
jgi:steroid delta-isomerase-like uncharacterized protein